MDWYYDENGNILHFPVDNYYYEGKRKAVFLGEEVVKYHRTLTTYLNTLLTHGFELSQVVEPQPPESMLHIPGMLDEMRRPMMLIVSARKRSDDRGRPKIRFKTEIREISMKSALIAESFYVARDIARVLKCGKNINGAIEGDRYVVTWWLGHLVTLADPEDYDKKYKEWKMETFLRGGS